MKLMVRAVLALTAVCAGVVMLTPIASAAPATADGWVIRLDPAQTRALATEPVRQVTTSVLDASSAADGPPAALMAAALDAQFVTWFAERITKSDPQSCMEVSVADGGGVTSLHGRGPCPWGSASITRGAVHSDPYA